MCFFIFLDECTLDKNSNALSNGIDAWILLDTEQNVGDLDDQISETICNEICSIWGVVQNKEKPKQLLKKVLVGDYVNNLVARGIIDINDNNSNNNNNNNNVEHNALRIQRARLATASEREHCTIIKNDMEMFSKAEEPMLLLSKWFFDRSKDYTHANWGTLNKNTRNQSHFTDKMIKRNSKTGTTLLIVYIYICVYMFMI